MIIRFPGRLSASGISVFPKTEMSSGILENAKSPPVTGTEGDFAYAPYAGKILAGGSAQRVRFVATLAISSKVSAPSRSSFGASPVRSTIEDGTLAAVAPPSRYTSTEVPS